MEQRPGELTSDEVWLFKLISTGEPKTPSKIDAAVKTVRGFQDLQAMLISLRQRGFIYYNDWNDLVIALPKAYQYLATYEASSDEASSDEASSDEVSSGKKRKKMEKTRGLVRGRATRDPKRS